MSTPPNIIPFSNASIDNQLILDNKTRNLANTCRNILANLLPQTAENLLQQLDDTLFELSNQCETHSRQAIYFDAMREIRAQQRQIQNNFIQTLLKQYDQFWRYGPNTDTETQQAELQPASQLSLLHEDDLEESLAINNIIKKVEAHHLGLLYAIEKRFTYMLKEDGINLQNNPVAPAAICHSFQGAICNLQIKSPARLATYKLFAKVTEQHLSYFYQTINDTLKQAGILPKLAPKAPQQDTTETTDTLASDSKEMQPPSDHKKQNHNNASKLFSTLQQLLKKDNKATDTQTESAPTIETKELLNVLTDIQQQVTITAKTVAAIEGALLKTTLHDQLENPKDKVLGEVTDDTIDIISLLFEIILDDKNLPDAMKALLGRLQIPILKVAILDKSFFSEKKHPARCLLNQLTQAAFTWSEVKDNNKDELYLHIEAAVERILTEFKRNISLFDEINRGFSAFYEQDQHTAKALEQRMQQISIGKEKLEIARRQVMDEVNSRIENPNAQPIIKTLLQEVCKDLLLLINLRQGQQSKAWKKSLALMDKLLWSTTPKQNQDEEQPLLKQMPAIHRQLKEAMICISFDPYRMEELLKVLRACQIASLHPTATSSSSADKAPEESSSSESADNKSNVIEEIVIKAPPPTEAISGCDQAQSTPFNIGTWFEITDDNGNLSRAKLAWRSITDGSLILVNRNGIKALETSAIQLSQQIQDGTAHILSNLETPLIDRALVSMMDQLKTQNKKQA